MSIFNTDDAPVVDPASVTFETLVGEDKKYKTPDDIARAKVHADLTIAQRERENRELREELDRRLSAEELLARARQAPNGTVQNNPPVTPTEPTAPKVPEGDDLAARIREITRAEREQEIRETNLTQSVDKLVEVYGSEDRANQAVRAKAQELGVSVEWLQSAAAQSPKAFLSYFNVDQAPKPTTPASSSDVNTAALRHNTGGVKEGTYAYYAAMRKENPRLYYTPATQNKMFADAKRLGQAFYT